MNDSKLSESSAASKGRSCDVIIEYYDRYFFKTDNLSLIKLMLYTPIGVVLVLARLTLLASLFLILCLLPALKNNPVLIRLVCFALGIVTKVESFDESKSDTPRIYVANHITCFDYVPLKSVVKQSHYLEEKLMNRDLTCKRASHDKLSGNLMKLLQYDAPKDTDDIYSDRSEFPFIFFPELIATNGSYGVLKFDPKPFSLEQEGMKVAVVPVALSATRPFVSLSLNWLGSNDLTNIIFMLFTPFTLYKMKFFPEQFMKESETSELFADRVQRTVANGLHLVCSNLDRENMRQMWSDYEKSQLEHQEQERQERQERRAQSRRQERQRVDAQCGDIGRVVAQVKNVLPHISHEIVRQHVVLTSSSDVDTVITSILDSGVSLDAPADVAATATANSAAASPTRTQSAQKSPVTTVSPGKFQSYETRKANLLSEARTRYLAKNQPSL